MTLNECNRESVLVVEWGMPNDNYLQSCKSEDTRKHGFLRLIHLQFPYQWDWHGQNGYVSDNMRNRAHKKDPVFFNTRCLNSIVPVTPNRTTLQHGREHLNQKMSMNLFEAAPG